MAKQSQCLIDAFYTFHDLVFRACMMSAINMSKAPSNITPPVNPCAATNCFFSMFTSDPAMGVPINSPKAATNRLMPNQVPTTVRSGVSSTITGGIREINAPAKKP